MAPNPCHSRAVFIVKGQEQEVSPCVLGFQHKGRLVAGELVPVRFCSGFGGPGGGFLGGRESCANTIETVLRALKFSKQINYCKKN